MAKAASASKKTAPTNKENNTPKATDSAKTEQPGMEPALMALFVDAIKDIYWAEHHLVKTLPKMQKAATSNSLATAIGNHLEETKVHVTRLEEVFELLGKKAQAKKCDAMEGLAKEGEGIIQETAAGTATRDVGIILASQKVEQYEIATYGGLLRLAETLGLTDVAALLHQTLQEEKAADEQLTSIAESDSDAQALSEA